MAGEQRRLQLWQDSSDFFQHSSSSKLMCKSRKNATIDRSEANTDGSLMTAKRNNMTVKKNPRSCTNGSIAGRPIASARTTRYRMISVPTPPPSRPETSLGICRLASKHSPIQQPQGFDLQSYIKKCGSANEVRIGINGQSSSSSDEYFERYMEECETLAQQERELLDNSSTSITDTSEQENAVAKNVLEINPSKEHDVQEKVSPQESSLHLVPLCWEDQLKKADPERILPKKPSHKPIIISRQNKRKEKNSSDKRVGSELHRFLEKISMHVSWKGACLFPWTSLKSFHTSEAKENKPTQGIPTVVSPQHKACVIPQATSLSDEDSEVEVSPETSFVVTDVEGTEHANKSLETACSDGLAVAQDKRIVEQMSNENTPSRHVDQLDIHFHSNDPESIKEFSTFSFEVSFLPRLLHPSRADSAGMQSSGSPHGVVTTPLLLSTAECVISIASPFLLTEQNAMLSGRLSLTCCDPRMLLFSVNIQAGHLPSPSTSHTQPLGCNESDTSMSTVPRKFLSERVNYCNQEDDEDRIDMNVLALHFPDLGVVDFIDSTTPTASPLHKSSSPIHRTCSPHHLNTMALKYQGKPSNNSTVTMRTISIDAPEELESSVKHKMKQPLYRPIQRWSQFDCRSSVPSVKQEVKSCWGKKSYVSIVDQLLSPYVNMKPVRY